MLSRRAFLQTAGAGAVATRLLGVTDRADASPALAHAQSKFFSGTTVASGRDGFSSGAPIGCRP